MNEAELARTKDLLEFQRRIGYEFSDPALLEEALTHSSYAHERGVPFWNERLEFLGDAVLEVLISEELFRARPDASGIHGGSCLLHSCIEVSVGELTIVVTVAGAEQV